MLSVFTWSATSLHVLTATATNPAATAWNWTGSQGNSLGTQSVLVKSFAEPRTLSLTLTASNMSSTDSSTQTVTV